jgi:hypothetical protein
MLAQFPASAPHPHYHISNYFPSAAVSRSSFERVLSYLGYWGRSPISFFVLRVCVSAEISMLQRNAQMSPTHTTSPIFSIFHWHSIII